MGIDYGSVRIGVSLSDELNIIAFGKEMILNNKDRFQRIGRIVRENSVSRIVLGYPLNLKGERTPQTIEVEEFELKLRDYLDTSDLSSVEIIRFDERFTSKLAADSLISSGMKKRKRQDKANIDIAASAILLQSYLDSQK